VALTKRADPAELKAIFLKVSIKESILFLAWLVFYNFRRLFQTALYFIVEKFKNIP